MRTHLTYLKNELFYNIIHHQYKYLLGQTINQKAFLLAFFPLSFFSLEENQIIIATQNNNSSRLSNIFSRATDTKRLESKFRKRFLEAFNMDFLNEMISNAEYYLKKHNEEAFMRLIQTILNEDSELEEHPIIHHILFESSRYDSAFLLVTLILWAFHIGDFEKIEACLLDYQPSRKAALAPELEALHQLIIRKHLKHKHVYEYLDIVTSYSASCTIGAIAMHAHMENTRDVNPLIYNELGNMLFYGYNYIEPDKKKALELFHKAADEGFGSTLWSVGTMTNIERHRLKYSKFSQVMSYFYASLEKGNPMALNNIGTLFHRALIHYLKDHLELSYVTDCFAYETRKDVLEIYEYFKNDDYFKAIISDFPTQNASDFSSQLETLQFVHKKENEIIEHFLHPAYASKYFYAKGSELMIYENQMKRMDLFYQSHHKIYKDTEDYKKLNKKISETCQEFSSYPCSESYYKYGLLLESKGKEYVQPAYEYYYNAVFEVPVNAYFYHGIWHLLKLHYSNKVPYLKEFDVLKLVHIVLTQYTGSSIENETLLLDILNIYIRYFKDANAICLTKIELSNLINNLNLEMQNNKQLTETYDAYLKLLKTW
ncbi:MAG: SEL1-like repeat protein [Clostridia bacterium]|nr:SEL1-like repeat protein [Clostridia bacterium]